MLDWKPNNNNQAVAKSEKNSIVSTALFQPLKINFNGDVQGHRGAIPIGPIVSVIDTADGEEEVLVAEAIVWDEEFPDITAYLKKRTAEDNPVGQSWELYFKNSYLDDNKIEWLQDCVFSAACLVDNPAYGPTRTRILSVAEDLNKTENREVLVEETRKEIEALMSNLSMMYKVLDEKYALTFEIEEAELEQTSSPEDFSSKFSNLVSKLDDKAKSLGLTLEETQAELVSVKAELETVTAEVQTYRAEKAQAEKDKVVAERKDKLSNVGFSLDDETKLDLYLSMSEDMFTTLIADFAVIKGAGNTKSTAEKKEKVIPEPYGRTDAIDIKSAHNEVIKQEKRG